MRGCVLVANCIETATGACDRSLSENILNVRCFEREVLWRYAPESTPVMPALCSLHFDSLSDARPKVCLIPAQKSARKPALCSSKIGLKVSPRAALGIAPSRPESLCEPLVAASAFPRVEQLQQVFVGPAGSGLHPLALHARREEALATEQVEAGCVVRQYVAVQLIEV